MKCAVKLNEQKCEQNLHSRGDAANGLNANDDDWKEIIMVRNKIPLGNLHFI